ncbi:MAG: hypothetical protein VKK32_01485 [Candidatus Melainabacteria bacterium]|nr:hypothetical protein [Candidatus Melainabacteria bacterium]
MAKTIKISDELFDMLKFHSHFTKRSVPKHLTLLAYSYDGSVLTLTLLAIS